MVDGHDHHVAGIGRVARLDPVDPRVCDHEVVVVLDRPRVLARVERDLRRVHDPPEQRVVAQGQREVREVAWARVVAGGVEPDRVRVARLVQSQAPCRLVHLPYKRIGGARHAVGQRHRRVIAAREQEPVQEIPHRHALARLQAEQRLTRDRVVRGRGQHLLQRQLAKGQVGRHELGGAGHRPRGVRVMGGQARVVVGVDEEPRLRRDVRRLRVRRGGSSGPQGEHREREADDAPRPPWRLAHPPFARTLHPSGTRLMQPFSGRS